ncbi:MAG: tol-pal system protein YbgF [Pseudomonadales bacterium]|nr:tol-pal system protein YbgF [Pseudomonadales bacterium]
MKLILAVPVLSTFTVLFSATAMGAAGVVESQVFIPGQAGSQTSAPSAASNDALVMLLDQFNEMRSELATLRGIVEEQAYELRRLQADSRDRYTDLDARISALYQNEPSAGAVPAPAAVNQPQGAGSVGNIAVDTNAAQVSLPLPAAGSNTPAQGDIAETGQGVDSGNSAGLQAVTLNTPAATPAIQPQLMTEQQLYQLALDSLLQEEQYQRSITEFDQYLQYYPEGRFVTNAWYWKGQAYTNLSMLEQARDSFEVIVTQYPDGRKVDDAMYSLGTVYDRLGNSQRARELLENVKARFPSTSAANLADIYLRSMN